MKKSVLILAVLSGSTAMAKVDGLACKMTYSATSVLETSRKLESAGWVSDGGTLEGTAFADLDQVQHAHSISVFDKTNFWHVSVVDASNKVVGSFEFPVDAEASSEPSGAKFTLPVQAYGEGSEDPTEFNQLDVVCENTIFAG